MSGPRKIALSKSETIVAVVPEQCSGPGWRNPIVHVYVANTETGKIREEILQLYSECSKKMKSLFYIGEQVCQEMVLAIQTGED